MLFPEPINQTLKHHAWNCGRLDWKLWPQQEPIYYGIRSLRTVCEEIVILCARQFGKSHLGVLMAVEDCLRYPGKCILIVGPTLKQAIEIVAPRMRDIARDAPEGLIRRSKSESKWYIGDSELVIGGFDTNSSSQRGKTVQNIYIEEVVDSNPDDYNESLRSDLGPALTHSDNGKIFFLTTLPKIPDHPFIVDTMSRAALNGVLYSYTIEDNHQLSPEQKEACIRRCGGAHTIDYRREYLNEIVRDPSIVVVPDFDERIHVKPIQHPGPAKAQVTFDWGGVRDLTVALLHWYDFQRNKFCFWDERWFPSNTNTEVIIKAVREMESLLDREITITARFGDTPGSTQVDLDQLHNYLLAPPPKDDWQAAVNNFAVGFTRNEIEVDPKCKLLIQTLKSGTFNKNRTDFDRTQTLGHCDAIACGVYGYRTQDRMSPIQMLRPQGIHGNQYHRPQPEELDVAGAIQPNVFSTGTFQHKQFGRFGR